LVGPKAQAAAEAAAKQRACDGDEKGDEDELLWLSRKAACTTGPLSEALAALVDAQLHAKTSAPKGAEDAFITHRALTGTRAFELSELADADAYHAAHAVAYAAKGSRQTQEEPELLDYAYLRGPSARGSPRSSEALADAVPVEPGQPSSDELVIEPQVLGPENVRLTSAKHKQN
jgi:hypothetical protein